MKFLNTPNLPDSFVKAVALGDGYTEICNELKKLNIDIIKLKPEKKFLLGLKNHADMQVFNAGHGNFFINSLQTELCEIINNRGGTVKKIDFPLAAFYPHDVLLNAASVGKYIICNKKAVCQEILCQTEQHIIHVTQGYTKCSICVVNSEAIITDDPSIFDAVKNILDVLLISKGDILLEGFKYGFIGGATFKLDKNILAFTGQVKTHRDSDKIKSFLNNHSVNILELNNTDLIDIGGVIQLSI
ncbi:MAG: hypothetical protein IJM97_01135 [Clostridia bacterium]|nr:hypothetical protein [Clostridia bacterium]